MLTPISGRYVCVMWQTMMENKSCHHGGYDNHHYPCDCVDIILREFPGMIDSHDWGYVIEEMDE